MKRPAVTVLAGFHADATASVAAAMLAEDPTLIQVTHSIDHLLDGVVRRIVRTAAGILEDVEIKLVHGCVSCTLREDVLPTLVRLAKADPHRDLLLVLPPAVEPDAVAAVCATALINNEPIEATVHFASYVTVVDTNRLVDDLDTTDDLRDRGLHAAEDDHRGIADVVVRQIEFADTIVTWPDGTADLDLLRELAPWARAQGYDPDRPATLERALAGYPLTGGNATISTLFTARRPFHPHRLHDALEELSACALRGRGVLWVASQPDTVIGFESAGGGVALGGLGYWLAALPSERWDEAGVARRQTADLAWDPYYGDRATTLAFVGTARGDIAELLGECLLTDAELARGQESWQHLSDPFSDCFPLPCLDRVSSTSQS